MNRDNIKVKTEEIVPELHLIPMCTNESSKITFWVNYGEQTGYLFFEMGCNVIEKIEIRFPCIKFSKEEASRIMTLLRKAFMVKIMISRGTRTKREQIIYSSRR